MEILEWSAERVDLVQALFEVMCDVENAKASRSGQEGNRNYKYADLNDNLAQVKPVCRAHDVLLLQGVGGDSQCVIVETCLTHIKTGQWVRSTVSGTPQSDGLKAHGSCISYLRRYGLQPMFNMFAEDDVDQQSTPKQTFKSPRAAQDKKPAAKPTGKASQPQIKAIYAIASENEFDVDDLKAYMFETFGCDSTKELTGGGGGQASKFIKALGDDTVRAWLEARNSTGPADEQSDESDIPF